MPRVYPFRALRYDTNVAGPLENLTAPPYDVISGAGRAQLLASSPYNVVHLDLAEGSDEPGAPDNRYERAAAYLTTWKRAGVLREEAHQSYYAYELAWTSGPHKAGSIRGLVCALELEPWGGSVVPHEHTMPGPVADRLELLRATRTHLSPVYGTVGGPIEPLRALLQRTCSARPSEDLTDGEGVRHRIWPVEPDPRIAAWLTDEELLIADGHHRYTTGLAYRGERDRTEGPGPWDTVLAFVVDSGIQDVPVLPYHRVQTHGDFPAGGDPVADLATLEAALRDADVTIGLISRVDDTPTYRVLRLPGTPPAVRALHEALLDAVAPDEALRFTHDVGDAERAVTTGEAVAAYILPPTTTSRISAAIHLGERLPRKSTFFWPKPRTGMAFMSVR
jgi:uncharacterized protein (DUF1015 family)